MRNLPIRIAPLSEAEWTEEQRELLAKGARTSPLNIRRGARCTAAVRERPRVIALVVVGE